MYVLQNMKPKPHPGELKTCQTTEVKAQGQKSSAFSPPWSAQFPACHHGIPDDSPKSDIRRIGQETQNKIIQ